MKPTTSHTKEKLLFLAALFMFAIGAYGIYQGFKVVSARNHLVEQGLRTEATITAISKEKCGYAYGYSASFTYTIDGKVYNGHCQCESRAWVREGDKETVAYAPSEPEKPQLIIGSDPSPRSGGR